MVSFFSRVPIQNCRNYVVTRTMQTFLFEVLFKQLRDFSILRNKFILQFFMLQVPIMDCCKNFLESNFGYDHIMRTWIFIVSFTNLFIVMSERSFNYVTSEVSSYLLLHLFHFVKYYCIESILLCF